MYRRNSRRTLKARRASPRRSIEAIAAQFSVETKFSAFHASRNPFAHKIGGGRTELVGARAAKFNWSERNATDPVKLSEYVLSVFSALSQGLEDDILENSTGLHGQ